MVDPNLINAWGLAFNPAGFAWVSANETGKSQVYDADGNLRLSVTIPAPPTCQSDTVEQVSHPTGQVFNASSLFKADRFIFVTEDGTVAGWQPSFGTNAVLRVDNSAKMALYKGVTLATVGDTMRIYAANYRQGTVDAFDSDYMPITAEGGFVDPSLPPGYAPFNIKMVPQGIIVTYALQNEDKDDDVAGPGNGFVDLYSVRGAFLQRLISGGQLNAPWGLAIAPASWGNIAGQLLVGNFGDGNINVYSLETSCATFSGKLGTTSGPLVIDGLWAIEFGPGAGGFETNQLFFTAGPDDEEHGLFGRLDRVIE